MKKEDIIGLLKKAKYWEDESILNYDNENFFELLKPLPKEAFDD